MDRSFVGIVQHQGRNTTDGQGHYEKHYIAHTTSELEILEFISILVECLRYDFKLSYGL